MRLPVRTIIPTLLLCCACFYQPANSQTGLGKKSAGATIAGKVTIKGEPAAGIVVGLRSSEPAPFAPAHRATSDHDGGYRITNVPQGTYLIAPITPAFVISDVNNSRGQGVIINEGENIEGIDFDLIRGGVITGRVTDARGRPIAEEAVNLLATDYPRSGSYHSLRGNFHTDDRGVYRIFGIRPGRYKVSVGEESVYRGVGKGHQSLPITFHPDTNEAAKATLIKIGEGTEVTRVDITLAQANEGFAVSGRVVEGETGKPLSKIAISLSKILIIDKNSSSSFGGATDVRSNADGTFRLEELAPGKYAISIQPEPGSDLTAERVTFDIIDQDITGLLIKTATGASLSGHVVLERSSGARNEGTQAVAWISVYLRNDSLGFSSSESAQVKPDGSFRVGGLPAGNLTFSVGSGGSTGNAKRMTISRVERDGVVQPNGIQIQTGEHLSGVRVVAAYSSGSIRGAVKVENGTLPPGGRLVISISKMGDANNMPGGSGTAADARGRFLIEGLATGTYELTVQAFIPGPRQRPRTAQQLVTVTDGSATDVMLAIDLTSTPMP